MKEKSFPDFVIPGAMKAGTTVVSDILSGIPGIGFSVPKEPALLMSQRYEQRNPGSKEVSAHQIDSLYMSCFRGSPVDTLWGEATTAYFSDEASPRIISRKNPNVKVIILLRDPVKRAFSGYSYCRSIFFEPAETMDLALAQELDGVRDNYWPTLRHMHYSDYPRHLRHWQSNVKSNHILLLEFEDFVRNPEVGVSKICNFLGIEEPAGIPAKEKANVTVALDTRMKRGVMKVLHTQNGLKSTAKLFLPGRFREKFKVRIQDHLASRQKTTTSMSTWCEETLMARFSGMQAILEEEFDFRPQHWTSGK